MDFHGKILLKYVCFGVHIDVGTQNLKVYPVIVLIIHTHVKENELGVKSNRRSWLEEPFIVLGTCIGLTSWVEVIHHKCQNLPQCLYLD